MARDSESAAADERLENRIRDRDYMLWVKTLACCAGALWIETGEGDDVRRTSEADRCAGAVQAHHAGTNRGMSQKAEDRTCIPLCVLHHTEWHGAAGPFRPWDRERRRAWALQMIGQTQARHARGGVDDGSSSIPW